ncbi:hypothetical protein APUTEX25_000386, partial [Auxenochlorella protothecoides]
MPRGLRSLEASRRRNGVATSGPATSPPAKTSWMIVPRLWSPGPLGSGQRRRWPPSGSRDYPPATTPARCMPRTAVPAPSPMCRDRRPPGTIAAPASCRWKAEYTEWPAIWAGARKTPPMMLCPRRSRRNLAMAW